MPPDARIFADVLLPLPLPQYYTYAVPFELADEVVVGGRVVVQFGRSRFYTALVRRIHSEEPARHRPKPIDSVMDAEPVVHEWQFRFWEWIAGYYVARPGEIMQTALPAALKLSSETKLVAREGFLGTEEAEELTDDEFLLAEALQMRGELEVGEVQAILQKKSVLPVVRSLVDKKALFLREELVQKYRPRKEKFLRLEPGLQSDEAALESIFQQLSRAPKQVEALMAMMQESHGDKAVKKSEFSKRYELSAAVIKGLVDKEIFIESDETVSRLPRGGSVSGEGFELSEAQQHALDSVKTALEEKDVCLLHGVTGSGKTNLYIEMIREALEREQQVLYLLPEIALTAQIIERLRAVFGNAVGIYHSKYSDAERVEVWQKVLDGSYRILLGARSSLFLPFAKLGLIIVDEEHDHSYKQFDPAPRYHARDCAVVLGAQTGAKVLLGTATPALETFHNCRQGKYAYVELAERFGGIQLPDIQLVDLRTAAKRKQMKGHFSDVLLEQMGQALEQKQQVILFQNRRGFAQYLSCGTCGWIPFCPNCDVSLTYHKFNDQLQCHLCGYRSKQPSKCEACSSSAMMIKGFGTEKVEEAIQEHFPEAVVDRLDYDTARSKHGHLEVIRRFEAREVDILVGTQMVTKGLDFDHVQLVGILNASNLMSFPRFNSMERAFQLMMQVAGRAGRKERKGCVVVQTSDRDHPVFDFVQQHDYNGFFAMEMQARADFGYPPHNRLIQLSVKHREATVAQQAANSLAALLRKRGGAKLLGPSIPVISRVRNRYIRDILIKISRSSKALESYKAYLQECTEQVLSQEGMKSVRISIDVDPV